MVKSFILDDVEEVSKNLQRIRKEKEDNLTNTKDTPVQEDQGEIFGGEYCGGYYTDYMLDKDDNIICEFPHHLKSIVEYYKS